MRVLIGIFLLVANLLSVLGDDDEALTPIPDGHCNYVCPIVGVIPVCGTDGKTYPSQCNLDCWSRVSVRKGQDPIRVQSQGRCPEIPCDCAAALVAPVCGTDGRTYPNVCELECESRRRVRYCFPPIYVRSRGECPKDDCVCAAVVQPVCGTDGRTYSNACELGCESRRQQKIGRPPIFIGLYGPCPSSYCNCPLFISPVCGSDGRSYRNICFLECASRISQNNDGPCVIISSYGVCRVEICKCPADVAPVCASNGNTFNNICALRCENGRRFALGQAPLTILYNGPCRNCTCPYNYAPVCGSDGRTYSNLCLFNCENQRRRYQHLPLLTYTKGECRCSCSKIYQPVCASDFRTYDNVCLLGCENRRRVHNGQHALYVVQQGVCGCKCSNFNMPVCGSDRRTYRNVCWFNCANFFLISNGRSAISIRKNGPC